MYRSNLCVTGQFNLTVHADIHDGTDCFCGNLIHLIDGCGRATDWAVIGIKGKGFIGTTFPFRCQEKALCALSLHPFV